MKITVNGSCIKLTQSISQTKKKQQTNNSWLF